MSVRCRAGCWETPGYSAPFEARPISAAAAIEFTVVRMGGCQRDAELVVVGLAGRPRRPASIRAGAAKAAARAMPRPSTSRRPLSFRSCLVSFWSTSSGACKAQRRWLLHAIAGFRCSVLRETVGARPSPGSASTGASRKEPSTPPLGEKPRRSRSGRRLEDGIKPSLPRSTDSHGPASRRQVARQAVRQHADTQLAEEIDSTPCIILGDMSRSHTSLKNLGVFLLPLVSELRPPSRRDRCRPRCSSRSSGQGGRTGR